MIDVDRCNITNTIFESCIYESNDWYWEMRSKDWGAH